jgi:hypothetical protein
VHGFVTEDGTTYHMVCVVETYIKEKFFQDDQRKCRRKLISISVPSKTIH